MSRIDEALRRVGGQPVSDRPSDRLVVADAPDVSAPDESILDRYVAEQTSSVGRTPSERIPAVAAQPTRDRTETPAPVSASLRGKLVMTPEIEPLSSEQYRRLAAALHELQAERGLKSLMVSSALPSDGKTLTVANLALTLGESYKNRVLLIDADLRRPSVHELFGLSNTVGLADLLRASNARVRPIQVSSTLSVLPAGRVEGSPLAALSSPLLQTIVADATARYDWVLLDTPPVGLLTDAHLVARATDGVVFVIAAGVTPYALVQRSVAEIGRERIVGAVLNRVDERTLPVRDYYHRHYFNDR
jgi:capsular exopolysaccharide synthesis family protein